MHGSHVQGVQVQFGLVHGPVPLPQLQFTQVQGSHVQFGLEQVVDSVVVVGVLLWSGLVWCGLERDTYGSRQRRAVVPYTIPP